MVTKTLTPEAPTFEGTSDADTVYGSESYDTISGAAGNDTLYGYDGDDIIDGGDNDDTLYGGEGNDTINGGSGNDTIEGGNQYFVWGGSNPSESDGYDTLDGGDGIDTLSYAGSSSGVLVTFEWGGSSSGGDADNDRFYNFENLTGSAFGDDLTGDDSVNVLRGLAGNDFINGRAGADTIDGGKGADTLDGGDGKDTLTYADSTAGVTLTVADDGTSGTASDGDTFKNFEVFIGSGFADTLNGGATSNVLDGGVGNDTINGGAGNDTLTGGKGNDTLNGGTGTDVLVLTGARSNYSWVKNTDGSYTVTDSRSSSDGVDKISNIENVKFSDQTVAVSAVANKAPTVTTAASISVAENKTAVTTVKATDPDSDTLTYSISGGADKALFSINASTGALTFKSAPNFEAPTDSGKNNIYDVTVTAKDAGGLSDSQAIAVKVTNANDAPVVTTAAAINVAENTKTVTTVTSTDVDAKDTVTYSISGGADKALFSINASTGALAFKAAPNFEAPTDSGKNNIYDVTVTATDAGGLSDSQAIAVKVTNSNEAPVVTTAAAINVAENTRTVTTVTSTDVDAKDKVTYSISGGADKMFFSIDASTGALAFKAELDFEKSIDSGRNNVYDVTVTATDEDGLSDSQAIAVKVTNVNEAPVMSAVPALTLAENKTTLPTMTATDLDAGDTLTYSISGGADKALFSINASTGALTFKSAPDYESPADSGKNNIYDVIVMVKDEGGLSDTQAVTVKIRDVVSEAPVITSDATISITENKTTVVTVKAESPDKDKVTYSISGGADKALFSINSSTGALIFKSAPDYELPTDSGKNNVYDVTVMAKDEGGLSDSQAIAVKVTDIKTTSASSNYSLSESEDDLTFTGSKGVLAEGNNFANVITGNDGTNLLFGFGGADTIYGGKGNDSITGGAGADNLYGELGKDTFIFMAVSDLGTSKTATDTIFDFDGKGGERISLSGIDANTKTNADNAFSFIGTKDFSKTAGELRYEKEGSDTYIYGDVDGDGKSDFIIHIDDALTLTRDYFFL